jgi:hypothetical protein
MMEKIKDWIDAKMFNIFGKDKSGDLLYETRWVWYHTVLVVELFIIILLLLYIGYAL